MKDSNEDNYNNYSNDESVNENSMTRILPVVIAFVISLYLVEFSSIGSPAVRQYNNGYGTFDMKMYGVERVREVLSQMKPAGFEAYKNYYVVDYFFILTFATLQILLLNLAYSWNVKRKYAYFIWSIPILRGMFDVVENTLLLITLNEYPKINETMIRISSLATKTKLLLIQAWIVLLVCGMAGGIITKRKNRECLEKN